MEQESKEIEILNNQDLTTSSINVKQELRKYWDRDYINNHIDNAKPNLKKDGSIKKCDNINTYKMLMRFLWITGVRVTEAINLRKRDINFTDYLITVRWQKSRKYLYRVLPMHPTIKDVLELFVANLKADELVFPITRQRAFQITNKYLGGSPHMLRHSFAVNWLRCDGDIVTLSRMLGHSKIQTTMEYLRIVPIDQGKELIKIKFR